MREATAVARPGKATERLSDRARSGPPGDVEALIGRHAGLVAAVVMAHLSDRQEAEDVIQETFLVACREFERLRRAESFGPWIATIARNLAIAASCGSRRRRELAGKLPAREPAAGDAAAERSAQSRRVLAEVEALPEGLREVFLLRYVESLGCAEIAAALDVPVGTVTSRLSRGHGLLRARLTRGEMP
jgi:RNA polymerase sigma-70 factor (ECF subfamily)